MSKVFGLNENKIVKTIRDGFTYYDFTDSYEKQNNSNENPEHSHNQHNIKAKPLAWLTYTDYFTFQVELELKRVVSAKSVAVRLIDMDDRTADFNYKDKAIDLSYIVFAGYQLDWT